MWPEAQGHCYVRRLGGAGLGDRILTIFPGYAYKFIYQAFSFSNSRMKQLICRHGVAEDT